MIYTVTLNPALDRELTVAEFAFDEVLRASESRVDVGGKGFNVSRMLAALGVASMALGFAGGRTGQALRDGLAALGIATDFVPIAGETRTNVSIVTPGRARYLKVNEPGPSISLAEQAALLARVRARAQPGDWWVLAGSLPPGVAPEFYADLIGCVRAAGGRVLLDTSGAALRAGCAARPALAKPNDEEASQITGLPVDTPEQALEAARAIEGPEMLVISLGSAGALLALDGHGWLATPPVVKGGNPIGAGDSLVAGLVWGFAQGGPLDALRWGVACGAATASQPGTTVGTHEQVLALLERVVVREL